MAVKHSSIEQCRSDPPNITLQSSEQRTTTNNGDELVEEDDMSSKQSKKSNLFMQSIKIRYFVGCLCTLLAMTAGILIVYFTAPRPRLTCDRTFQRTMKSTLTFSSQPRFIASADLNNDHQIDLLVTNSGTDTIGVFMGQGNGSFAKQRTYSTGAESHPRSLTISDFNNDSYLDIAVANYDTNSIGLFLGYGNGTFIDQKLITLSNSHPVFVSTADFNKDNQTDIAVVNNGTNSISILFSYGNGSFQYPVSYSTGYDSHPCSLAVGDLDHDTYLDITVTNSGTNNIGIFLNYGNGTLTPQHIYTTMPNSKPLSIASGDLNNDTILDIVVAYYSSGRVGIFFGVGNGTLLSQVSYRIGSNTHPQYVTVSNVNNIDVLDIVIVDSEHDHIHILPGYGNGSFATIATYDSVVGSMPVWITVNDLNNNTQADVATVNYGTSNAVVLMDYFAKPSAKRIIYYDGDADRVGLVAVSDFNNDDIPDIVCVSGDYIVMMIGLGNLTFDEQKPLLIAKNTGVQYLCVGDINHDYQMDIILANTVLNGINVFLGYGNGSFDSMTTYSTGTGSIPFWIALGDLNDDNRLDMVSANYGTNSISILLGNRNGSFSTTGNYSTGNRPLSVAVGDLDNDQRLDIVVSTDAGRVRIYIGRGNSTFSLRATYITSLNYMTWSISLGHLNGDNYLDIVVANTLKDNIGVLLGYGNGTFAPQTTYPTETGAQPYYVIIADCNNDNISDIVATLLITNEVVILYGYGNGQFYSARNFSTGLDSTPLLIAAADLDNDTHVEFVVALYGPGDVAMLIEYIAAQFVNRTVYSTGSVPQGASVAVADFNNDNQSDIVVANSGTNSLSILLASTNNRFSMEMMYPIGIDSSPQYVITCDINKDNYIDIVSVNSNNNSISLIMGYGNGSFAQQIIYPTGDNSYPSSVVVGDVNNDNRFDLVVSNKGINIIGVFYGYDYSSFQTQQTYSSMNNLGPRGVIVSDFNNDNILDIVATFSDSDTWCVFLGYGNGSFIIFETYSLPKNSYPYGIGVGDLNKDKQLDIVITNSYTGNIGVYLGYGNGSFSTVILYSTGQGSYPLFIACNDFNNDTQLDIVVANRDSHTIGVFLGYENGSFTTMTPYSTGQGSSPNAVTVADLNNDGRLDIAVANQNSYNVGVLLGYGNGTFRNQVTFLLGINTGPVWISVADFNRDNHLDIATANGYGSSVSILLGYGNGSFASVVKYSTGDGSRPNCISVGDFNNDNRSDIAVANYATNTIVVLFGLGDGSFLLGSSYSTGTGSLPYALANGDFNEDGRLDIVVVNAQSSIVRIFLGDGHQLLAGLTPYQINDGSQPQSLALGHFNNDTWIDIVVANYGTNTISILFGHPHGNFTDIKPYSTGNDSGPYFVAIDDFNKDAYFDIVVSNSKSDNIIIFFGDGIGGFIHGETYSTGTQSRPYIVRISDFNNDNISDIAVANSGTNNVLVLYGYGNGTFGNQTSYPFGYGYEPYSISVGDLNNDNWMDIVIACYSTDHVETLLKLC